MLIFEILFGICTSSILILEIKSKNSTLSEGMSENIGSIIVFGNLAGLVMLSCFTSVKLLKSLFFISKEIKREGLSWGVFNGIIALPF